MFEGMFSNVNLLQKGLDATWLKGNVISNNIANVDTPNFKASQVDFETLFKQALEGNGVAGKVTNKKHISIGITSDIKRISPVISEKPGKTRMDGSNVDIEAEMAQLARNSIQYNYMIQKVSKDLSMLKTAISEGK